jgi:two-component system capsular synthesis response regulator RcsB
VPCDILVTDYAMPGGKFGDGMSLISFLRRRHPSVDIIVFTMLNNPAIVREMSAIGVKAVLSKMDDLRHLVSAIVAVGGGAAYLSPHTLLRGERSTGARANHGAPALTRREEDVLRLYVAGQSINEIAKQLHRSKQTISAQKMSAMRKIGIERDADLFRFAYEMGMGSAVPTGETE